jgi:uncharacterized protein
MIASNSGSEFRWFSNRRKSLKMSPLRNDDRRSLLQIARRAIESALTHSAPETISSPEADLAEPRGVFVTLHCGRRLRGCIGRVVSLEPLARVVAECAVAAATDDPRFPRVERSELGELQIELSVLSRPSFATAEEVQPGVHGLIISRGAHRGVLLPQVAVQHGWARERFLEETCRKAELAPGAWQEPDTRIEVFTAEVFSETNCAAPDGAGGADADAYSSSQ